ncbi:MAG: bifunctional salicylyl-CoA 5-hydroxylase/oxidoreductase [Alphaproteobacteria bacterium]
MKIAVIGGGPGGLYFSILMKKARPEARIDVYERNRADDTFGFGVVFSDETLDTFLGADLETYEAMAGAFAYWDEIDFVFKGETIRSDGHGFCGCGRRELLLILQGRARALGVGLHFEAEIDGLDSFADADLIVAGDGVNSAVRARYAEHFKPAIQLQRNHFLWLGTDRPLDAFTFDFTENEHGIWIAGGYQYNSDLATWIVEAPEETWASAGPELQALTEEQTLAYMERLWASSLRGHRFFANRSVWRVFPTIRCENWHFRNIVLIGDALHTAHYSIGSGTKLAMEDALALVRAIEDTPSIPAALERFEEARREESEKIQHAANVSVTWTENPRRYWNMEPIQAAFSMLSRSKQVTYDNLRLRDEAFVERIDRWFAGQVRAKGHDVPLDPAPPPIFTPLRLRAMTVVNRVVVSPMDMYSAEDGATGDFHFVHYGALAHGGAGLIFSEMTCVSRQGRITPGCAGLYAPEHVVGWKRIIDFVHRQSDACFAMQIGHCGPKGSTGTVAGAMDRPLAAGTWALVAPSPVRFQPGSQMPREMSREDMREVCAQFVAAARMAEEAGADMIELHMAHGYLLSSFITPVSNRRDDEYGGSLPNRLRYPLEVFAAVRAAWPSQKPISVRISATDWIGEDGITGTDAVEIARRFAGAGCDLIDVSAGQTTPEAAPVYGRMFQTWLSEMIRNEAGIATIAVGNITSSDQVNTILAGGRADLVALARPHLSDPHFTLRASADYGFEPQRWPSQYESGKEQAFRLAAQARAEDSQRRAAMRPKSHRRQAAE